MSEQQSYEKKIDLKLKNILLTNDTKKLRKN